MTVQINVDETLWAEAVKLARDLNIDQEKLFIKTLTENLNALHRKRKKAEWVANAERKHKESYEKFPVTEDEFFYDEEMVKEVWKDL